MTAADKSSYPWPVRGFLLLLLDLPEDATEKEYLEAFEQKVKPLIAEGIPGIWNRLLDEEMKRNKNNFQKAWDAVGDANPRLKRSYQNLDNPNNQKR